MGTPAEDAAYQRALTQYRVWCESVGQMPDPGYIEEMARLYNQGLYAPGMGPATPQPTAPAVPGGGAPAVPGGAAPAPTGVSPAAGGGSIEDIKTLLRSVNPDLTEEEIELLAPWVEQYGLYTVLGSEWYLEWIRQGGQKYISDNLKEVGLMNAESNRIIAEANAQGAETDRLYKMGLLDEAAKSREQELLMSRELNALNKYIAEMENQVATLGLQIQERAYGAQLGAHPVNTVEFELWKRAGGSVAPVEIPTAPVPQAPVVPTAPTAPAAAAQPAVSPPTTGGGVPVSTTAQAPGSKTKVPYGTQVPGGGYQAGMPRAARGLSIYSPKGSIPVRTARPGELHTTGERGWEYLRPGPGTVVAPRARGETRPTQEGGQQAINRQLSATQGYRGGGRFRSPYPEPHAGGPRRRPTPPPTTPPPRLTPPPTSPPRLPSPPTPPPVNVYRPPSSGKGKRVPYGWMKRRQALGFRGELVPGMQGGGVIPGSDTHTDEEMAQWLAESIKGWPALYNPNLRGAGVFGSYIPGPQEMGRRKYYSMDPSEHSLLTSFLEAGLMMPSGERGPGIAEDWLRQMQRSWIPGLEGAKRSVSYAY